MRKLTGAALATVRAAIRELNDNNPGEAALCVSDLDTVDLPVTAELLEAAAALARRTHAQRPHLRLVAGE
jgi:hypothetical protein